MTRKPSLLEDSRGAILVMGVFMAVFLVGCLWYIIGVGDAALYRQKMQDGSDAAAFASSVYHARGMNIIALLNLLMAAVLAVLITLKIASLVAWTVVAIATVLCPFTGAACGVIGPATTAATNIDRAIKAVEPWVDKILKVMSEGQRWVARITPWVGGVRGVIAANAYGPMVKGGVGVSVSMIPMGAKLGLPVEEDSFKNLCGRGGEMVVHMITLGLNIPGVDYAAGLLGSLVKTFPGYFCGDGGGEKPSMDDEIANQCKSAKDAYDQQNKDNKDAKPFDMDKCQEDAKKKLAENGGTDAGTKSPLDGMEKTSKKVFSLAKNGDDYFQVYGIVLGDNELMKENAGQNGARVEQPAWGKSAEADGIAKAMEPFEKFGITQSEFYYDQTASGKLKWDDYKDDAMWNLRWRARLRRVHVPSGQLLMGVIEAIPGASHVPEQYKQQAIDPAVKMTDFADSLLTQVVVH